MAERRTLDRLAGGWWIAQLERGHRYATDDILTAWTALGARPGATRILDLGAGVGSVGLLTLLHSPTARLVSVEVQETSVELLRETVRHNQLDARVEVRHGDLRAATTLAPDDRFDVIVANPPFLPPSSATASPHPQRAAARLELHGDIFDYCAVAAEHLTADGRFCFCHAARDPRPERAVARAGLTLLARRDVVFREAQPPTISLFVCAHEGERRDLEPLTIRHRDGRRADSFRAIRREMSLDRDFRAELAGERFWDCVTQASYEEHGEAIDDCILQNREEIVALCEWIEAREIRSYLEIGIWTGRLVSLLHRLFAFDTVAACDHGWAEECGLEIRVPTETRMFRGNSESPEFLAWREQLGPIDLVLIDANHAYHAVKHDFEINRRFPHRFIALHDITGANRHTIGIKRLWDELGGHKVEIKRPHVELGLDHSVMGIGIWSDSG